MNDWIWIIPLVIFAAALMILFEALFPGPTDEEIGFCPDGQVHCWKSEYAYDNAGGEYTITSCERCGA